MSQRITPYIPLRISNDPVLSRDYTGNIWRTNLLIESIDKFFGSILTMILVVPTDEIAEVEASIKGTPKVTISVIDQETILPGITTSTMPGWYKQQVLSFAMTNKYSDLVLLKLDPDLILVNSVDHADFFSGTKTANDLWHIQANRTFTPYVECSELLGMSIQDQSLGLKWTPFIFDPEIVGELMSQLNKKQLTLLDLGNYRFWTEALLYNIAANSSRKITDTHFHAPLIGSTMNNIRRMDRFKIIPEEGIFATIQGFTGVSEPQVNAILANSKIVL